MAGSRLRRNPDSIRYNAVKVVTDRLATVNTASPAASTIISPVGTGIFRPSPTKKSVTKKSRRLVTFAVTSSAYGNVDNATPAMSAPISRESDSRAASSPTRKHHAMAPTSTSSGRRATLWKSGGSTYRLAAIAAAMSNTTRRNERPSTESANWSRLGCTARKRIAKRSCSTSTPRVIRPASVSSSRRS